MPSHHEEIKRFYKNPREEPDTKFSDEFEFFARKVDLKEEINNPKATESEQNRSKDQYIELIENDSKSLEKKNLELRGRVSSLSHGTPLTKAHRTKGGKAPKYDFGLQQFVDQLFAEFEAKDTDLTPPLLKAWLVENAPKDEGYDPVPEIPDCGDIEFYEGKVWWKDRTGRPRSVVERSLEPYIRRARESAGIERA